jgi:hypothetical protein
LFKEFQRFTLPDNGEEGEFPNLFTTLFAGKWDVLGNMKGGQLCNTDLAVPRPIQQLLG